MKEEMTRLIRSGADGNALRREVEEELRFHLEMRALEYESQGFSAETSFAMATRRFGNISAVRKHCLQIRLRNNVRFKVMRVVCAVVLVLGICVKVLSTDYRVAQIGHVLILISLIGSLLMFVKIMSTLRSVPDGKLLSLGLVDSGNNS